MGGNVGSQTATIIVRGLATVSSGLGAGEIGIGLLLGTLYGALIGIYTVFAYGESETLLSQPLSFKYLALSRRCLAVGVSIFMSMAMSAFVGAATLQSLKYRSSSCDRTDRDDDGGCIGDADVFSRSCSILGT